jgi:hypothetical protein
LCPNIVIADHVVGAGDQAGDERAIDLQLVDRQAAQVAERRVAGAEIVDDDPHAHLVQALEAVHRPGDPHQDVLAISSAATSGGAE